MHMLMFMSLGEIQCNCISPQDVFSIPYNKKCWDNHHHDKTVEVVVEAEETETPRLLCRLDRIEMELRRC